MHLLLSTLCIDSPVLPLYDVVLRESLPATLNIDLDDISVSEHQLSSRTPAYAEQRLLLMAITVSFAVVVLVVTAATIRSTIYFAVHL